VALRVPGEAEVLGKLVAWGRALEAVRALVLTSTRASPHAHVDVLSDYDVVAAVRDPDSFLAGGPWRNAHGEPLVGWGDESELEGFRTSFRGVLHRDGVRIDWTVWPEELLGHIAEGAELPEALDVGYRVLLDKDGRTAGWPAPTYRAHVPNPPGASEYRALVEEFWWDTTYVAKGLARGHVVFAKFALDYDAKLVALRRVLEWLVELDHDWAVKPGAYGKGIEELLRPELREELLATYVGAGVEETWDALFRTTALFRRVATEVGRRLAHAYPHALDDAVTAYLEAIRAEGRIAK
jgi:aminoglycoside 6-adenylyltransferase